jgi:hypothetical protein
MSQTIALILVSPGSPPSPYPVLYGVNSVATVGGTLQYSAFAFDTNVSTLYPFGNPIQPQPSWTWTTSNGSVATVNSSGLVTGAGAGICTITASIVVGSATFSGSAQFGCALITPATATVNFGTPQTFTVTNGPGHWFSGVPAGAQMWNGTPNTIGNSATAVIGGIPQGLPSSVTVPVYALIGGLGGVVAAASLVVNNIP